MQLIFSPISLLMIGIRRISVSIQFYQYLFGVIDFYFYFTSDNIKTLILYVIIR